MGKYRGKNLTHYRSLRNECSLPFSHSSQSLNYHCMSSILGMEQKYLNIPEADRYVVKPHSNEDVLDKVFKKVTTWGNKRDIYNGNQNRKTHKDTMKTETTIISKWRSNNCSLYLSVREGTCLPWRSCVLFQNLWRELELIS